MAKSGVLKWTIFRRRWVIGDANATAIPHAHQVRDSTLPESVNPYAPVIEPGTSVAAEAFIERPLRYAMSALVFVAGLGLLVAGVTTFASLTLDERQYATHGPATFEWTLVSAALAAAGSLWMLAAILYLKRHARVAHWILFVGFLALLLSLFVRIPV